MNQEFLNQLEQWNEEDQYQKIIDAIEALPEEALDFTLTSALARAYNNLAIDVMPPEDRPLYQRALDLLLPLEGQLEEAAKQDPDTAHTWNFRVAYAYYYLNQESQALPHFEKALEARPGDEDTLEFIDRCQQCLALPLYMRPFRGRTEEGWSSFLAGEGELRALMDQEDREAVGEKLVDRCTELLAPAFADVAFELGHNGEKYELILTPEGDRSRLFQLAYFRQHAPRELLKSWNIKVGRCPCLAGKDAEQQSEPEAVLRKAGPPDEGERGSGLQHHLYPAGPGPGGAGRHAVCGPSGGPGGPGGAGVHSAEPFDPELAGERYTAYEGKSSEEEDWPLRADVYVGVTCCIPLLNGYFQNDDYYMDRLHQDGVVPGFFYYPLDGVDKKDILNLRDQLEQAIEARCGEGIVTFTGGATGTVFGYLDFIAWDLRTLLDAAVEVFAGAPVDWAAFHTLRSNAGSIGLKAEQEA